MTNTELADRPDNLTENRRPNLAERRRMARRIMLPPDFDNPNRMIVAAEVCALCGGITDMTLWRWLQDNGLEVDHIRPVRSHPELAFALENLQSLCAGCHTKKTRIEVGHPELSPERQKWRDLVSDRTAKPQARRNEKCLHRRKLN